MEDLMPLLVQLASGAIGGNLAGKLMKDKSLGTLWNSVAGILVGGLGGQLLGLVGLAGDGGMDLGGILGSVGSGGVGGGLVMAIIGALKGAKK